MANRATYALVHAPLVGPSSWSWVSAELKKRGHRVIVPDLTGVESTLAEPLSYCVQAATSSLGDVHEAILVGHSGSGILLPLIVDQLESPASRFLFVDAGLPPVSGPIELAQDDFRAFLTSLSDDQVMLKPWSQWWGEQAMELLVPDADRRALVESDIPRLPLRYYDAHPNVPPGWSDTPCAYLRLSEGYADDDSDARSRGWPVQVMDAHHLHMAVDPAAVATALEELAQPGLRAES